MGYERAWWVTSLAFFSGSLYAQYEEQIYNAANRWWILVGIVLGIAAIIASGVEYLLVLPYIAIPIIAIVLLNRSGYSRWIEQKDSSSTNSLSDKIKAILTFLSKISYELYLVHGVVIIMLRGHFVYIKDNYLYGLLVIVCSILLATAIHKVLSIKLLR